MQIAAIQMDVAFGQPKKNQLQVENKVKQAVQTEGAKVVVLPELWNTGFDLARLEEIADRGELVPWLSELSSRYEIFLVAGSIAEMDGSACYNTCYVFAPDGSQLFRYRKLHLFRLMKEEQFLSPGDQGAKSFSLGDHQAGSIICYDVRFPELARSLALDGATLMFVPAQWPHPRLKHWRILNQARAVENQMFVVAVNRVGQGGKDQFFGHSMIIDPWGNILAEGTEEEEIITVDVDLGEVERIRNQIPVFKDRVPSCYRL